jgi:hypothetical protein
MYACEICGEPSCGPDEHCEECLELLCFCTCENEDDEGRVCV